MKVFKLMLLMAFVFILTSCGDVSYPKENMAQHLEEMLKKEHNIDGKVFIVGQTLYLDIMVEGFVSQESEAVGEAFNSLQTSVLAVLRIVLSSDSDIKFMIINAYPQNKSVVFRMFQNIDDFKEYYYMKISKGDYESRNLMEIEGPDRAEIAINDKHDMSLDEYVGRMIVSYLTMSSSSANPLVSVVMSSLDLKYSKIENNTLIITAGSGLNSKTKEFLELHLSKATKKFQEKYQITFNKIQVKNPKNKTVITI